MHDFTALCLPWRGDLIRFASRLARNRDDAEDVVQEAFLQALKSWPNFKPDGDPVMTSRAWLFRIVANKFNDSYRQRRDHALGDARIVDVLVGTYGVLDGYVDPIVPEQLGDQCLAALDRLRGDQRELVDRASAGQKYKEMSEALGIPIGTVMSRLSRARAQLAEDLGDYARQEWGITGETPEPTLAEPAVAVQAADTSENRAADPIADFAFVDQRLAL